MRLTTVLAFLLLTAPLDFAKKDAISFARWVDEQADMSPKWRPRYVRLCTSLPVTPTNKVLTRVLAHEKFRADQVGDDDVFVDGAFAALRQRCKPNLHRPVLFRFVAPWRATIWPRPKPG